MSISWRRPLTAVVASVALLVPLGLSAQSASADPLPSLVINEVESSDNVSVDWIELKNVGASGVDASGMILRDNKDADAVTIASGTTIAAGGYLAVDVDITGGFGLGGSDQARLFEPDGTTLIDSYTWTEHAATTYGRCPDGTGPFTTTYSSTKGGGNICNAVRINEVESNGGTPGDWVELYNAGTTAVDLSGWKFKDSENSDAHTQSIPDGASIAAGGYYVIEEGTFGLGTADSARVFLPDGTTLVDSYSWTAHAATTYGRCEDGTGNFTTTTSSTKGAANDCSVPVRINEVESSGGTPGDWIELKNNGAVAVDVSGYILKDDQDDQDDHTQAIPAATFIPAGGYLAIDTSFGLGDADSARLFAADGTTLIDSYTWTAPAATTYGRCPDGTGEFATTLVSTKGAVNSCNDDLVTSPWPGGSAVSTVDDTDLVTTNLSGLDYEPSGTSEPGTLWAVDNGPGTLYRLLDENGTWRSDTANGWSAGKAIHYTDGAGNVDSEGVTITDAGSAAGVYVSSERDNDVNGVSRPAVLRYDPASSGTSLTATTEWNLTADLPAVGPNLGLEAITWVPDSALVAKGFVDEHTGTAYDPAAYADHGSGLFFVGLEANGFVYAYALKGDGTFTRVASFSSGFPAVMDLQYDPETGKIWADCDDTCDGRVSTLDVAQSGDGDGHFAVTNVYERPTGMANINNEGFALAPQALCVDGAKPVYWSDDADTDGHSLREGTVNCTVPPVTAPPVTEPDPTPSSGSTTPPAPAPTVPAPTAPTPSVTLGIPTVSGTASIGSKLTAKPHGVAPAAAALTYQWLRNGTSIAAATSAKYTLTKKDAATRISVRVTASLAGYTSATATSAPTPKIGKPFAKTSHVSIGGRAKIGSALKAKTGTWSPKPRFAYRWYANGKSIAKATHSSLTVTKSLKAKKITVTLTAKKSGYTTTVKTSKATAKVK